MAKVTIIKRSKQNLVRKFYFLYFVVTFLGVHHAFAQSSLSDTIDINAVVISNTISPTPPPSPGPISNNGVPLTTDAGTDRAIFKGRAYPNSLVALLKNGLVLNELPANIDGTFEVPVNNIKSGTYTFGVRAKDNSGLISAVSSYTIYIAGNVETEVSNIFLSPTISTDKLEVAKDSTITFSGYTFPRADVVLTIFARSGITRTVESNASGYWSYTFSTTNLDFGEYSARVQAKIDTSVSSYSTPVTFTVGTANKLRPRTPLGNNKCDLNNDSRVNLIDFSIMAFWYKRLGFPPKVDLNSDSRINLTDLSILAYCWTG